MLPTGGESCTVPHCINIACRAYILQTYLFIYYVIFTQEYPSVRIAYIGPIHNCIHRPIEYIVLNNIMYFRPMYRLHSSPVVIMYQSRLMILYPKPLDLGYQGLFSAFIFRPSQSLTLIEYTFLLGMYYFLSRAYISGRMI